MTGQQKLELDEALRDAFRTRNALRRMVSRECDRNLDDIAGTGGLEDVVFELVEAADSQGWVDRLLAGGLLANAGNPSLRALYDRAWPTNDPDLPRRLALESLIEPSLHFFDVDVWLSAAQKMSRRVCRIRAAAGDGTVWGTGFLVGTRLLLTNLHVVAGVVDDPHPNVTFQFDYRVRPDGSTADGVLFGPAADGEPWLVSSSPHSSHDEEIVPTGDPSEEELDYALIRLDGALGAERGWIDLNAAAAATVEQALVILQHPDKQPLKLALDTKSVLGLNANRTRVTYRTNTLGGSSGAPCFDLDWQPVALHHSGDPAELLFPPSRNEGIPLAAITSHLARHGHALPSP